MKEFTIQSAYDGVIQVTRETGQGVSYLMVSMHKQLANYLVELESGGYLTKHESLGDTWYMPKDCYNVWDNIDDKELVKKLMYLRIYLEIDDGLYKPFSDEEKFKVAYNEWVNNNLAELKKLKTLKTFQIG